MSIGLIKEGEINSVWSRQEGLYYKPFVRICYFDQLRSKHSRCLDSERFITNYQQSSFQFGVRSVINVKFFE